MVDGNAVTIRGNVLARNEVGRLDAHHDFATMTKRSLRFASSSAPPSSALGGDSAPAVLKALGEIKISVYASVLSEDQSGPWPRQASPWTRAVVPGSKKFVEYGAMTTELGDVQQDPPRQTTWWSTVGDPLTVVYLRYDTAQTLELRQQLNPRSRKHARLVAPVSSSSSGQAANSANAAAVARERDRDRAEEHKDQKPIMVKQEPLDDNTRFECDLTDDDVVVWKESRKRKRDEADVNNVDDVDTDIEE